MAIDAELTNQLIRARAEVEQHPIGELSFATRHDVLRAMGPLLADAEGRHTIIGPGLRRRTRLAISLVRPVLPLWEAHYPAKHPHRMLELAQDYIDGRCDREKLRSEVSAFSGALDTSDTPDKQLAYIAARAAVSAGFVAESDELLEPDEGITKEELEDPQDPDHWDCAYWAAGAVSGGMQWEAGFDPVRHKAFWLWYVDTAVPAAWSEPDQQA